MYNTINTRRWSGAIKRLISGHSFGSNGCLRNKKKKKMGCRRKLCACAAGGELCVPPRGDSSQIFLARRRRRRPRGPGPFDARQSPSYAASRRTSPRSLRFRFIAFAHKIARCACVSSAARSRFKVVFFFVYGKPNILLLLLFSCHNTRVLQCFTFYYVVISLETRPTNLLRARNSDDDDDDTSTFFDRARFRGFHTWFKEKKKKKRKNDRKKKSIQNRFFFFFLSRPDRPKNESKTKSVTASKRRLLLLLLLRV